MATAEDTLEEAQDMLRERAELLRGRLEEADHTVREVVREHPVACVAGALLGGYLLGRLVARL